VSHVPMYDIVDYSYMCTSWLPIINCWLPYYQLLLSYQMLLLIYICTLYMCTSKYVRYITWNCCKKGI